MSCPSPAFQFRACTGCAANPHLSPPAHAPLFYAPQPTTTCVSTLPDSFNPISPQFPADPPSPFSSTDVDWDHRNNCRWWPNPRSQSSPCYLSILDMIDIILSGAPFARKLYTNENELRSALPRSTVRPHVD